MFLSDDRPSVPNSEQALHRVGMATQLAVQDGVGNLIRIGRRQANTLQRRFHEGLRRIDGDLWHL